MQVREVAKILDVSTDTVRYYVREGLITPMKNLENGYREFLKRDVERLRFVLSARQLGFSVNDIREILNVSDKGDAPCPTVKMIIEARLEEVEKQFHEVSKLRKKMRKAIDEWKDKPEALPNGNSICYLIENFQND